VPVNDQRPACRATPQHVVRSPPPTPGGRVPHPPAFATAGPDASDLAGRRRAAAPHRAGRPHSTLVYLTRKGSVGALSPVGVSQSVFGSSSLNSAVFGVVLVITSTLFATIARLMIVDPLTS
jgi:hypothetical protein